MSKSVLIIGAGGFIGRHLVEAIAATGEHVIAAGRRDPGFNSPAVEVALIDLHDPVAIAALVARSRVVVHAASASTPASTAGHPMEEVSGNLAATAALLQVLQEHPGVELLYLSSGGTLYGPTASAPADELARVKPKSYHGAGKVAAEYFIQAWCSQYAASATILRPSNIYGPGQYERAGFGVVPTALGKIGRDETLRVWGDGSAVRDYLYVDDLVRLVLAIIARPVPAGVRTINACSGLGVNLNQLFKLMESVTGHALHRDYQPGRAVDAARVVMDPELARREYGWSPTCSLRDGLERTWAWLNTIQR